MLKTGRHMHEPSAWRHYLEIHQHKTKLPAMLYQKSHSAHANTLPCLRGTRRHYKTLQFEASVLLGHSKSCPKGFSLQTHHLFPPVTGSYTPTANYKKHLPTLLNTSKQQHQPPCLNTLFSFALRVPLTCHSKTSCNMLPSQVHLLDNTDMHRCNVVLHVDPVEEYTENNLDLS